MIGPIENQRPGFITHPFCERSRKTIPLEKRLDTIKNEILGLVT